MYPKHRLEVINRIKQDLTDNRRIIVSSTQLIEAGVDIDFNELFRQLAPLDAIIQSAGRCNREGKRAGGNVWIFVPEGENIYPGRTYRAQAVHTRDLLKYNLGDIFSTAFFERYYSEVVYLYTKKEDITQLRKDGSFDTVDSNYRLINETSTAVFIIKDAEKLYDRVKDKKFLSRKDFQDLQLYSVHLFDYAIYKNDHNIERLKNGLLVWHGKYSDELGIDAGEEHLEALIF
jgi:CRISPR-associated endonuclease/helicase Cas3